VTQRPRAAIVTVGSELTSGDRVDTNSGWLSLRLEGLGFEVLRHRSCPDEVAEIALALTESRAGVEVVLVTGGLGPTRDDLTRDGVAQALGGVSCQLDLASWEHIQTLFERFGRVPSDSNRRQAELPEGARVLLNEVGTAPGFVVDLQGAPVYALPGVPREMRWLWDRYLSSELAGLVPVDVRRHAWSFRTVGIAESALGERLLELEEQPDCEVRYCVEEAHGTIHVSLLQSGPDRLAELSQRARDLVGEHLCAEGDETLAEALVRRLTEAGQTVATAESCTGGRVAGSLTAVPGASAVFLEGVVSYSNQAKARLLGVPSPLIEAHGAVSEQVARAMAEGVRDRSGATLGLATTGIAGPTGGTESKPVGLVHFAVAREGRETQHLSRVLPGSRALIQSRATATALDLLRRAL